MRALRQALEIILEVQRKRSNEKIIRRKISFLTNKTRFLFFFLVLFGPLLLSNLITFFLKIKKQFNLLYECHLKFYKSSLNFNSNKATHKECLDVWEPAFVEFSDLFF